MLRRLVVLACSIVAPGRAMAQAPPVSFTARITVDQMAEHIEHVGFAHLRAHASAPCFKLLPNPFCLPIPLVFEVPLAIVPPVVCTQEIPSGPTGDPAPCIGSDTELACYESSQVLPDLFLGNEQHDFHCPVGLSFRAENESVDPESGLPCGSAALIDVDAAARRATVRLRHSGQASSACELFGDYEADLVFFVPVFDIERSMFRALDEPSDHTLRYEDIYTSTTSPLPLRWLRESTAQVPSCPEPCGFIGSPLYGVSVHNVAPVGEPVVAAMLTGKFCDFGLSPPAAPDCVRPEQIGSIVAGGPQLNATLPKAGVVIPPIFSDFRPELPRFGLFDVVDPLSGLTVHDVPLLVTLVGEPFDVELLPISFASGSMRMSLHACNLGTIQDIDVSLLDDGRRAQAPFPDPQAVCPTLFDLAASQPADQTLPTSVQRKSVRVRLDEVGVHYVQLRVLDDFGTALRGQWIVSRYTPVVYVHGWNTIGHPWKPDAQELHMAGYTVDAAEIEFHVDYGEKDEFPETQGPIWTYARDVAQTIAQVRRDTRMQHVDLVAHSMGGLVVRYYDNSTYPSYIRKIASAGSPLHGSDVATLALALPYMLGSGLATVGAASIATGGTTGGVILLWLGSGSLGMGPILSGIAGPAVHDMVPHSAFLVEMNRTDADGASPAEFMPNDNQITIVAGRVDTQSHVHVSKAVILADAIFDPMRAGLFWSLITGDFVFPSDSSGDGIVTHESAALRGIEQRLFELSEVNCSGMFHSCFFTQPPVASAVRGFLLDDPAPTLAEASSSATPVARDSQAEILLFAPDQLPRTISMIVPVDLAVSGIRAEIVAAGTDLSATLSDPEGNVATPVLSAQEQDAAGVRFSEPAINRQGRWQLDIMLANPHAEEIALYISTDLSTSAHVVVALTDRFVSAAEAVTVVALGRDVETIIPMIAVDARVVTPSGRSLVVPLFDDGVGADVTADDQAFANTFADTTEVGTYHVDVRGQLLIGPSVVDRTTQTEFEVVETRNLRLVPGSVQLASASPSTGECVQVVAEIENVGSASAQEAEVLLLEGRETGAPEPVDATVVTLGPQESAAVAFTWRATHRATNLQLAIQPAPGFRENVLLLREDVAKTVRAAYDDNVVVLPVSVATPPATLTAVGPPLASVDIPVPLYAVGTGVDRGWDVTWEIQSTTPADSTILAGRIVLFTASQISTVHAFATATGPAGEQVSAVAVFSVVETPEFGEPSQFVALQSPTPFVVGPQEVFALDPVELLAGAVDDYGVVSYRWIFEPDAHGTVAASGPRAVLPHGFAKVGVARATLLVNDMAKLSGTAEHLVEIRKRPTQLAYLSDPSRIYLLGEQSSFSVRLTDATPGACSQGLSGFPITVALTYADGTIVAEDTSTGPGGVAQVNFVPHVLGDLLTTISYAGDDTFATSALPASITMLVDDMTPPRLLISGVEEDRTYDRPITIVFAATDINPSGITATLDGASFESGTIVSAYGEHTLVVSAVDTAGNVVRREIPFRLLLVPAPVSLALCAEDSLEISNKGATRGFDRLSSTVGRFGHVASAGDLTMSNSALVEGDAVVGGNLAMSNSASISGDVFLGGTSSLTNTSAIGGTIVAAPWPGELCSCGFDLDVAMTTGATTNDNGFLFSDPEISRWMTGGALVVSGNAHVTLPAGAFFLTGLGLHNGAALSVLSGARVTLLVHGPVEVRNAARFNFPPAQAANVWIITDHEGTIELENATENAYRLLAPRADVHVVNAGSLLGTIVGRNLRVANTGVMLRDVGTSDVRRLIRGCPVQ